jgi:hypothetical protein
MKKFRKYTIWVTNPETAVALDQTAHLDKKLNNSLEFTITSRVSPIDLMNIPDIQRIVALTPYR